MYNPHQHAEALGLRVLHGDPGPGRDGLYIHPRTIILRAGLTHRAERSVLSHEVVHAEWDDRPTTDPAWHARREARADRIAAHRLIADQLHRIQGITDPAEWCRELDVLPWVITTYMRNRRHAA